MFATDDDFSKEAYHERGVYSYAGRIILSETACNAIFLSNGEPVFWSLEETAATPAFGQIIKRWSYLHAWYWHRTIWFPHWLIVMLASIYPLLQIGLTVQRRRRPTGGARHCDSCGYDLRASTNRCPECGLVVVPSAHLPQTKK